MAELLAESTVRKIRVEPGDVLVLTYPHHVTVDEADRVKTALARYFGDTPVLVLGAGATLEVVSVSA